MLGEREIEGILHRLDRLTQEEGRITVAQTLEVVYGLVNTIKIVKDGTQRFSPDARRPNVGFVSIDGKASVDGIWKAFGEFLPCSEIGVVKTDRDHRYDARDCERYKQDEVLVINQFYYCSPVILKLVTGNRLQRESRNWLMPPNPSPNYNIARKIHQDGTAAWSILGKIFVECNSKGSLLWIRGKRAS